MKKSTPEKHLTAWKVFLGCFVLFSLGTIGLDFFKIDVRFALFVEDMARYGTGVFPTINGAPYTDYFSPFTFLAYLFSLGGRFFNQWTLALGAILCSSATAAVVYSLGERLRRGAGAMGVALFLFPFDFASGAVSFGMDNSVALTAAVMLLLLERAPDSRWNILWFFCALCAACALRGPMGLVLVGAVAAGWLLGAGKFRTMVPMGLAGAAAAGICFWAVRRLILEQGGEDLWNSFRLAQVGSRMKSDDTFFYFTQGLLVTMPASFFALAGFFLFGKRLRGTPLLRLTGAWVLPLVVLTIPGCKHIRYMTPALAPMALCGAWVLVSSARFPRWRRWTKRICGLLDRILPWPALVAGAVLLGLSMTRHWPAGYRMPWAGAAGLVLLTWLLFRRRRRRSGVLRCTGRFCLAGAVLVVCFAVPFTASYENSRVFVEKTEALRKGKLLFYRIHPDHEALKYVVLVSPEKREKFLHLYTSEGIYKNMYLAERSPDLSRVAVPMRDILIVEEDELDRLEKDASAWNLRPRIVTRGRMGHREYCGCLLEPVGAGAPVR